MSTKNKILSVKIEHKPDTDPESSNLGTYSNQRNDQYAIERVNCGSREYRWFNPCADNYAGCTEEEIRKYCQQDYERAERLNAGDWGYIGIIAKASVQSANNTIQTLRSGGLWGVESDAGKAYHAEIEGQELENLRAELTAFGFGKRAIDFAFKNVSHA